MSHRVRTGPLASSNPVHATQRNASALVGVCPARDLHLDMGTERERRKEMTGREMGLTHQSDRRRVISPLRAQMRQWKMGIITVL